MFDPEQLMESLQVYGIHFLVGDRYPGFSPTLTPAELLAGLAVQSDARLRLALIAVLLQRPDFVAAIDDALELIRSEQRPIFQLYYTAACCLQSLYYERLVSLLGPFVTLPDFFSKRLGISEELSATGRLKNLARVHQEITGLNLNWFGTYQHAASRVIRRLEKEREWQRV